MPALELEVQGVVPHQAVNVAVAVEGGRLAPALEGFVPHPAVIVVAVVAQALLAMATAAAFLLLVVR